MIMKICNLYLNRSIDCEQSLFCSKFGAVPLHEALRACFEINEKVLLLRLRDKGLALKKTCGLFNRRFVNLS